MSRPAPEVAGPRAVRAARAARAIRALLRGALAGALAGAVVGLGVAHAGLAGLAPLQVGSQAVYLGALAQGTALAGGLAGALGALLLGLLGLSGSSGWAGSSGWVGACARVAARAAGTWPGCVALATLAGLELHVALGPAELAPPVHAAVVLAAALGALLVLALACRAVPVLASTSLWSAAVLVLLAAAVARVGATPAMEHGLPPLAALSWAPLALVATAALGLGRRPRAARAAAALAAVGWVLAGVVWVRAAARDPAGGAPRSPRPNVLVVTVDTLRADHVGAYGARHVRTPSLDALAADGVLWERAISPIPTTNPAHSSLFTGLYPGNHGVINNAPYAFLPGIVTLPELCEAAGYRTAAFVSGYTLKRDLSRLFRRFQVYDDVFGFLPWVPSEWRDTSLPVLAKRVAPALGLRLRILDERFDRRADDLVDAALDWLDRNGGGPFCLWLHLYDPHMPYDPPAPFDRAGDGPVGYGPNWYDFDPEDRERSVQAGRPLERFRDLYAGEVEFVDHELGRLLAGLDERGLRERTLVVLTSDHGESLGEHDYYFDHSYYLYDTCLAVPLIARFPDGLGRGQRIPEQARLVDVLPTVVEALGLAVPDGIDGTSLLPRVRGAPPAEPEPSLSVTYEFRLSQQKRLLAVRTDRWKYVRTSYQWDEFVRRPEREELYDLAADPGELHDLAAGEPELLARFRELAREPWARWVHDLGSVDRELSEEQRDRLRSLGYF